MDNDKVIGESWISYKDDDDSIVNAYVYILEKTPLYIKFRTNKNIITISYSRLIKLKEKC